MRWWIVMAATAMVACGRSGDDDVHRQYAEANGRPETDQVSMYDPGSDAGERDWTTAQLALQSHADSIDRRLRQVRALTGAERTALRRDVNEVQLERARRMGVRVTSAVEPLVQNGRLVRLPDTTSHWIVRELDYSVPFVTPDALALLVEIGERFHERLDSLGVPRYRLDITSVLRTPDKQAELRRRNSNAAREESAHEFGTTVDIAYRRFAPAAGDLPLSTHPTIAQQARMLHDSLVVETGRLRGAELQAVLGRVLRELQDEGKVLVRMERRQTVYHITVARSMPRRDAVASSAPPER